MVARKKKHFIVICIPHFHKLQEYIILDRSIALIQVYSRQNIHKGRFFYYTTKKKELLYGEWKRTRWKNYAKWRSFGGSFLEYMPKIFTDSQMEAYEKKKDVAIMSLGEKDKNKKKEITEKGITAEVFKKLRENMPKVTLKEWAIGFDVSERTLSRYSQEKIDKQ